MNSGQRHAPEHRRDPAYIAMNDEYGVPTVRRHRGRRGCSADGPRTSWSSSARPARPLWRCPPERPRTGTWPMPTVVSVPAEPRSTTKSPATPMRVSAWRSGSNNVAPNIASSFTRSPPLCDTSGKVTPLIADHSANAWRVSARAGSPIGWNPRRARSDRPALARRKRLLQGMRRFQIADKQRWGMPCRQDRQRQRPASALRRCRPAVRPAAASRPLPSATRRHAPPPRAPCPPLRCSA